MKGLDRQNQRMRDLKKPGTMIEKEKIKGMARISGNPPRAAGKEMNDRRNKWFMFSKHLEKKGAKKRNDGCWKQVFTINSLADVSGVWGMQLLFYILKLKILIIVNHCYLMGAFFSTHRNDDVTKWPT